MKILQKLGFKKSNKPNKEEINKKKREMCGKAIQSNVCPHDCDICAWNTLK